MMDTPTLRKADVFSGAAIVLLGIFIISQAVQMPMKDSWGGVQNVWFVSPALFPLLVGGMLTLLGTLLISIALKTVGKSGMRSIFAYLSGASFLQFLQSSSTMKFYAIVFNLVIFVFVMVPHVDFFLAAIYFMLTCFFMFYFRDDRHLVKIFVFAICAAFIFCIALYCNLDKQITAVTEHGLDWLVLVSIPLLCLLARTSVKSDPEKQKRFRTSLVIGIVAPMTIGIIFKYFLLVPMPYEGLIVQLLDAIWYAELWS